MVKSTVWMQDIVQYPNHVSLVRDFSLVMIGIEKFRTRQRE